ncbi:hypothetical protein ACR79P_00055 [Sphingobacterium spiritivorum]|uniref:hypothetical protein n=2 Tax=Sphingobacterium spiritivorum TaxID=258 RepID=UPI003DA4CCA9
MKILIPILTTLFLLIFCKYDSISMSTLVNIENNRNYDKKQSIEDSVEIYHDSLYFELELNFTEISEEEFHVYKDKYNTSCVIDSSHFIQGSYLYIAQDCKEICDTYLCEKSTNRKLRLPSGFDSGISTILLSPSCTRMIICSSYDGPDYSDYYENRAEMFVFSVTNGMGIRGIKPAFKYYSRKWSIEELTWVNEHTIALKVYEANQNTAQYKYLKTELSK